MELNCIIFPAKLRTNISRIQKHILLIPKDLHKKPVYYNEYSHDNNHVNKEYQQTPRQPLVKRLINRYSIEEIEKSKSFPLINKNCQQQPLLDSEFSSSTSSFKKTQNHIPCLFLEGSSHKLIVYFHGNAQDLTSSFDFLRYINKTTSYSLLAVEYPGYSLYQGSPSSDKIQQDAVYVIKYLLTLGYNLSDISVLGRSIGSGPAVHVASKFILGALILISPFTSICSLIKDKYGLVASALVQQRFQNISKIAYSHSSTLIIHGLNDGVIPHQHSVKLQEKSKGFCKLKLIQNMTHTTFDFRQDFLNPLLEFLISVNF